MIQFYFLGETCQCGRAGHSRLEFGKFPFAQKRKGRAKKISKEETQNGIPKEFQNLIVTDFFGLNLIGIGTVGEGFDQEVPILKAVAQSFFQVSEFYLQ